jgi:adenylosuccinate synthase
MRYSTAINGYTSLNLTKLDVLDGFEEIKIATGYLLDGKQVEGFPGVYSIDLLSTLRRCDMREEFKWGT